MADRGLFGDMFGAINSLFSGLAFVGIIYTIFLQQKELELQRKELKLTREELKRQAEAQEKSGKILSKTAKLNALAAILNHEGNIEIAKSNKPEDRMSVFNRSFVTGSKANGIIDQIKSMIKEKD